jgi:hypothetical protein
VTNLIKSSRTIFNLKDNPHLKQIRKRWQQNEYIINENAFKKKKKKEDNLQNGICAVS